MIMNSEYNLKNKLMSYVDPSNLTIQLLITGQLLSMLKSRGIKSFDNMIFKYVCLQSHLSSIVKKDLSLHCVTIEVVILKFLGWLSDFFPVYMYHYSRRQDKPHCRKTWAYLKVVNKKNNG